MRKSNLDVAWRKEIIAFLQKVRTKFSRIAEEILITGVELSQHLNGDPGDSVVGSENNAPEIVQPHQVWLRLQRDPSTGIQLRIYAVEETSE